MSNGKPVVFVTRKLTPDVEARLRRDYDARLNPDDRVYGPDELIAGAQGADAVLTCSTEKWPAEIIRQLPESVRAIATFSVGYEHIDLDAARARGLIVTNTPEVLTEAVADVAMLLLLGAARRATESADLLRTGRWDGFRAYTLLGLELHGSTLGIVGMGRIGRAVARRARGFGLEIHYHNRNRLPPELEEGAVYHNSLDAMLPHCRFVSINCPADSGNRHMFNAERIALMPEGSVLINTARGALVDDEALLAALKRGPLFAAGLDVFENEPALHPGYLDQPTTFQMKHIGSATVETRNAMGFCCLDNLDAIFAGRPAPNALT
jgi:lactate dehydrogenase-like 2-hydroxyacid dehydrogenase